MSKRKLNRRQKWRIEKIQEEKKARAEKKQKGINQQLGSGELGAEQKGLIIAHYGQRLDVEAIEGPDQGEIFSCFVRANIDPLVTGDTVIWRNAADQTGIIEARENRDSLLQRPDNYGLLKPVAANIDRIIIVVAIEPTPFRNLIDRYLVAAETTGITPGILFNKMDLLNDDNRTEIEAMMADYQNLGYEIITTTAACAEKNPEELLEWMSHHTSIMVGQSGVGKSSLIRAILGDQSIRIGELSENTRKGTHTTTTARLFHLPAGGQLIDSPGIREFGLWHIDEDQLISGFREFRPHIGHCKFRDCQHDSEPGCAINKAHEEGLISDARMKSYRAIRAGLNDLETYE